MENTQKVGYAYVPVQKLAELYSPEKGLERGTIFPELDLSMKEYCPLCNEMEE